MARGSSILSAILGGVGGGVEAGLAQRERERVAREREEASKRQQAELEMRQEKQITDLGYVPTAARTAAMEAGAPTAVSAALSSAMGAMQGGRPGAITATPQQQQAGAAMQGMFGKPLDTRTVGGREYGMFETPVQAATRKAEQDLQRGLRQYEGQQRAVSAIKREEQTAEEQRNLPAAMAVLQFPKDMNEQQRRAAALDYLRTNRSPFLPMDAAERERLDISKAQLDLSRQQMQNSAAALQRRVEESDRDYNLRLREQERREADSIRRMEKLPVSAQNKMAALNSGIMMARDAVEAVEANPDALGLKNLLPGIAVNRLPIKGHASGVGVRALIEGLTGEIRNQRFGGQLTVAEAKFAEKFLPDAKDDPQTVLQKLRELESYLETKRKGIFSVSGAAGDYTPLFAQPAAPAPSSSGASGNPYR